MGRTTASASATEDVDDPASLVDPLIGAMNGPNMFPGSVVPFGMMQWSPDTPSRPPGGGYDYGDSSTFGFSLAHISGPGCSAFGDVPILPTVGAIGASPSSTTMSFSHGNEHAAPGYYQASLQPGLTVVPSSALNPPDEPNVQGLRGEYFDNMDLSGDPVVTRVDPQVSFDWGGGSPAPDLPSDHFSVRWTGTLTAPTTGDYELGTTSDDGSRLYLDDRLVVDNWGDHPPRQRTATVHLDAGPHTIRVDYYENGGGAMVVLGWREPGAAEPIDVQLTTTTRAGIGQFTFPQTDAANLLFKLSEGAMGVSAATTTVVSDHELSGSVTSGHFCGGPNTYTLHFNVVFDRPFTAYGTWTGDEVMPGHRKLSDRATSAAAAPQPSPSPSPAPGDQTSSSPQPEPRYNGPPPKGTTLKAPEVSADGLYVTFDATDDQTVHAKVGISFVGQANAAANREAELPGWDFDAVRQDAYSAWNDLLGRIEIAGGTREQQVIFYTALYHSLLHPNVFSDVDGQYAGFDGKVHTVPAGHLSYANYSGWDVYRSQFQLLGMLVPDRASDMIRTMLDDYAQTGMLPKWTLAHGESYIMVGDPAAGMLAGAYAFGARGFDRQAALAALVDQATTQNNIRPGIEILEQYGYLPVDEQYSCCNFYGPVSTQQEYDYADVAVAMLAKELGDEATWQTLASRANNWLNVFNPASGFLQPKAKDGSWTPGFSPTSGYGFVEGNSWQYTPMVPWNIDALVSVMGGDQPFIDYLDEQQREHAWQGNEPSLEIPWEWNFAHAPWKTQARVREIQQTLYSAEPEGEPGNDDLGAMSSWYVWSTLGMYPFFPGSATLVLNSPQFPRATVHMGDGKTIVIEADGAAPDAPYVQQLKVNGVGWSKTYLPASVVDSGATLQYTLGKTPNEEWGSGANAVPPSYQLGQVPAVGYTEPSGQVIATAGGRAESTVTVGAQNVTHSPQIVQWSADVPAGLALSRTSGQLEVPPEQAGTTDVTVKSGSASGRYRVTFHFTTEGGAQLPDVVLEMTVAQPGELWPFYNNIGISDDSDPSTASFDRVGYSYSAQALAAAGVTPGSTVNADGLAYIWPDVPAGELDNIQAAGQTIKMAEHAGAATLGILGAAAHANPGSQGTLTVHYTDGSSAQMTVGLSDWTLGAGSFPPAFGNTTAITTDYRNHTSGYVDHVKTYVFSATIQLDPNRTVESVTLPQSVDQGDFHVFDIAFG